MSEVSNKMNSDEKIQHLYHKTKNLQSPTDLDNLILGKIRMLEEEPAAIPPEKPWIYLPIAASILLAIFLQFKGSGTIRQPTDKPIEIVKIPAEKQLVIKQRNAEKNQLPETFFLPNEDINSKIVPACNGELIEPETVINKLTIPNKPETKGKSSDLPIKLIYPNNANKKTPACDRVSGTVFKKRR